MMIRLNRKTGIAAVVVLLALGLGVWLYQTRWSMRAIPETNLFSLGQVAANRGDCKKAIQYYEALLSKDPRHSTAIEFLAECLVKLDDTQGAIKRYETLIQLENTSRYRRRLSQLYERAGMKTEAAAILQDDDKPSPTPSKPPVKPAAKQSVKSPAKR